MEIEWPVLGARIAHQVVQPPVDGCGRRKGGERNVRDSGPVEEPGDEAPEEGRHGFGLVLVVEHEAAHTQAEESDLRGKKCRVSIPGSLTLCILHNRGLDVTTHSARSLAPAREKIVTKGKGLNLELVKMETASAKRHKRISAKSMSIRSFQKPQTSLVKLENQ